MRYVNVQSPTLCTYAFTTADSTEDRRQSQDCQDDKRGEESGGLLHLAFLWFTVVFKYNGEVDDVEE